jgi:hypothetical protein
MSVLRFTARSREQIAVDAIERLRTLSLLLQPLNKDLGNLVPDDHDSQGPIFFGAGPQHRPEPPRAWDSGPMLPGSLTPCRASSWEPA